MTKLISWASSMTTFFITGVAFVLSYSALLGTVQQYSQFSEGLSYLWPLLLDALLAVAALAVIRAGVLGSAMTYPRVLVVLTTALSVTFNVLHSNLESLISVVIHGSVPVFFFLSFELLMTHLKDSAARSEGTESLKDLLKRIQEAQGGLEEIEASRDSVLQDSRRLSAGAELAENELQETREELERSLKALERLSMDEEGPSVVLEGVGKELSTPLSSEEKYMLFWRNGEENRSVAELAKMYGVSKPTIYSWRSKVGGNHT